MIYDLYTTYINHISYIYIFTPLYIYISFTSTRLYIYISLDMHVYLDHFDKNIATIGPRPAAWAPASPWPPDGALAPLVSGIRWINGRLGPTFRMKMDEGWFTFSDMNDNFWDFMKDTDLFFQEVLETGGLFLSEKMMCGQTLVSGWLPWSLPWSMKLPCCGLEAISSFSSSWLLYASAIFTWQLGNADDSVWVW